MPHFLHKSRKIIISTNYKVLYTSLFHFNNIYEISNKKLFNLKLALKIKEHYLLVRDPYEKLISFYKDKFVSSPKINKNSVDSNWQHCQKIFFRSLNIKKNDSTELIGQKFLDTSFSEFISILPDCYNKDLHLHPQNWIRYVKPKLKIPFYRFTQTYKIESPDDMKKFAEKIDIDLNKKKNSTKDVECDVELNSEIIRTINKIYKRDFNLYSYKQKSS